MKYTLHVALCITTLISYAGVADGIVNGASIIISQSAVNANCASYLASSGLECFMKEACECLGGWWGPSYGLCYAWNTSSCSTSQATCFENALTCVRRYQLEPLCSTSEAVSMCNHALSFVPMCSNQQDSLCKYPAASYGAIVGVTIVTVLVLVFCCGCICMLSRFRNQAAEREYRTLKETGQLRMHPAFYSDVGAGEAPRFNKYYGADMALPLQFAMQGMSGQRPFRYFQYFQGQPFAYYSGAPMPVVPYDPYNQQQQQYARGDPRADMSEYYTSSSSSSYEYPDRYTYPQYSPATNTSASPTAGSPAAAPGRIDQHPPQAGKPQASPPAAVGAKPATKNTSTSGRRKMPGGLDPPPVPATKR